MFQLAAWMALAAVLFVTLSPLDLRPSDPLPVNFDRAAAFMLMAALFVLAYPRSWFLVGCGVVIASGGFELLQELSPTRHAHLNDAIVKAAGALIGVMLGWTANKLRLRLGL